MDSISLLLMTAQEGEQSPLMAILPFVLILVVLYFFIFRPQAQKAKKQRQFKDQVEKGDKVVTIGGIHGRVKDIKEDSLILDVGNDIRLQVEKSALSVEATETAYGKKGEEEQEKDKK